MVSAAATESRLVGGGVRMTGPRRAVMRAIESRGQPFTVEEICDGLPEVGRATVFRTVKLLQELELVCRLPLEDGGVRYQLSQGDHHHHLNCRGCGVVAEFVDLDLDALIAGNAARAGFSLAGHSVELYGLCSSCSRRSPTRTH